MRENCVLIEFFSVRKRKTLGRIRGLGVLWRELWLIMQTVCLKHHQKAEFKTNHQGTL